MKPILLVSTGTRTDSFVHQWGSRRRWVGRKIRYFIVEDAPRDESSDLRDLTGACAREESDFGISRALSEGAQAGDTDDRASLEAQVAMVLFSAPRNEEGDLRRFKRDRAVPGRLGRTASGSAARSRVRSVFQKALVRPWHSR
jgi:hypothetical protein